eukprot:TRINITY_DN59152_c0_g1_i1.p1 TRINITY_DN59152_c0_g1~~TRINITY_DN59152_c0_g1_i1.p1  ORF type:complete len:451 (-),score=14.13 TRINITY_DN59152_c0_g1_i1:152-1504(-)
MPREQPSEETDVLVWKAGAEKTRTLKDNVILGISTITGFISGGTGSVFLTKSTWAIQEDFFVLFFVVVGCAILCALALLTQWHKIKPEERCIAHKHLLVMGGILSLCGTALTYCSPHVSGLVQAILGVNVLTVPLGVLISKVLLRKKYSWGKYLGVLIVLAGVGFGVYTDLSHHKGKSDIPHSVIPQAAWDALFTITSVFALAVIIYQDEVFLQYPVRQNMIYVQTWVMTYQSVVLLGLCWFDFLPAFGSTTPSGFFNNQARAMKCFLGLQSGCKDNVALSSCHCDIVGWNLSLLTLAMCVGLVSRVVTIAYSNATFCFISSSINAPLTTITFALPFMMKPFNTQPMNYKTIITLVLLVLGMLVYAYYEVQANTKRMEEKRQLAAQLLAEGQQEGYGTQTLQQHEGIINQNGEPVASSTLTVPQTGATTTGKGLPRTPLSPKDKASAFMV